ncbi:MAG: hypothetical protein IT359_06790 [Gemmatimonadaceae bacterium]|nr:hypothetical protein [Gemmatimonadaceae bacterium]
MLVLATSGCLYSLSGGGGLPKHVRTVAVVPFENETVSPELTGELHSELRKGMMDRLGLRDANEQRANAVVTGKITSYEVDVPVSFSADPNRATSARRRLQLKVDVKIIDQTTGKVLFERSGVSAEGEYNEREEPAGRKQAIQRIVNEIIEGAQSQW